VKVIVLQRQQPISAIFRQTYSYTMGEITYGLLLVGRPEGKRPLRGPRRRWMDNIKMDIGEIGWGGWFILDWCGSGQGLVEGSCECGNEPSGFHKILVSS
jgi:hypothetical protein